MARVETVTVSPKGMKVTNAQYSFEQLSSQLADACAKMMDRTRDIERNEKKSWARARNRNVGGL